MKKITGNSPFWIIIGVFIISRIILREMGVHMNFWALYAYWQYLDVETLKQHLINGVWYDHAQPPVFNLFLGLVLKIAGSQSPLVFDFLFKCITLGNAFLLFFIVKKITPISFLPLLVTLAYILSPATMIFECELFYTTLISGFLLLSVYFLICFADKGSWLNAAGIIFPLVLLCLTRSVYHIVWLMLLASALIIYFRKTPAFKKLLLVSLIGVGMVGSWYVKNKIIFGKLTASTWIGMNIARNVFHDNEVTDSSRIEAYAPFSQVNTYRKFTDTGYDRKFAGLNDRDLLMEMKNDSFINETAVRYIPVSDLYLKASIDYIKSHPAAYMKNVMQSCILYFTPATMYSLAAGQSDKIKIYDVLYSFNLTHFAKSKQGRRILLSISAIPKCLLYLFVFFLLIRYNIKSRSFPPWNLFILLTIGFVFGISSFFEHYENMRFRFETEPLFLILSAQVFSIIYFRCLTRRKSQGR